MRKAYIFFLRLSRAEQFLFAALLLAFVIGFAWSVSALITAVFPPVPLSGGAITEGFIGFPKIFNPVYAREEIDRSIDALVFDGLYRIGGTGDFEPALAQSGTWNGDGREFVVRLRPARFSDGTDVTSDDVVTSFLFMQNEKLSPYFDAFSGVTIVKIDATSVKFTLPRADYTWQRNLTFKVIPKHLYTKIPTENWFLPTRDLLVGSGPFVVSDIQQDASGRIVAMTFDRNPYRTPRPYLDRVTFRFYTAKQSALDDLVRGKLTGLSGVGEDDAAQIPSRFIVRTAAIPWVYGLFASAKNEPKNLARTVTANIDWGAFTQVFGRYGDVLAGDILPQAIRRNLGVPDKRPSQSAESVPVNAITVTVPNDPFMLRLFDFLKQDLAPRGVALTSDIRDIAEIRETAVKTGNFGMLFSGLDLGFPPDLYSFFHSKESANFTGFAASDTDALLDRAYSAKDRNTFLAAFQNAYQAIAVQPPAVFLLSPSLVFVEHRNIRVPERAFYESPADRFSDIGLWYTRMGPKLP